jgi:hypothetical protein
MDKHMMLIAREIVERRSIPVTESGCWLWEGSGVYGRVTFDKKRVYAHRLSYTAFKGFIPSDESIIHKCHNPCCVNPDHLALAYNSVEPENT